MPSTNKTPKLGLNNWVGTDKPKRADFVADNTILDGVIAGHMEDTVLHLTDADRVMLSSGIVTDMFAGDGAEQTYIGFPFNPRAVIVFMQNRPPVEHDELGGYMIVNFGIATLVSKSAGIMLDRNKVYLSQSQSAPSAGGMFLNLNKNFGQYAYLAFR